MLKDRIVGYPESAPQSALELLHTDKSELDALEITDTERKSLLNFRNDLLSAVQSSGKHPLATPDMVKEQLEKRWIKPIAGAWLSIALDKTRNRILVPRQLKDGTISLVYQTLVTRVPPTAERLYKEMPLATGGVYLIIYGGGPGAGLDSGHARELKVLRSSCIEVADVLFWHLQTDTPPALYSLRKRRGDCGGKPVEFPSLDLLKEAE